MIHRGRGSPEKGHTRAFDEIYPLDTDECHARNKEQMAFVAAVDGRELDFEHFSFINPCHNNLAYAYFDLR